MSHTIHRNNAFVISTGALGEANLFVDLLTEDFGVVRASAQGIRFLKSKLRYSVGTLSLIDASLVRGREVWRLINASKVYDLFYELEEEKKKIFIKLFSMVKRFVQGEESHPDLFVLFKNLSQFLLLEDLNEVDLEMTELISVLRFLAILGYVEKKPDYVFATKSLDYNREVLADLLNVKKTVFVSINQALQSSGL